MLTAQRRSWLTAGLGLLAIVLLSVYIYHHQEDFRQVLGLQWEHATVLFLLSGVQMLFLALANRIMYCGLGLHISLYECFCLSIVGHLTNQFFPGQPGAAVRAVYLHRRHQFGFSRFAATFLAFQALMVVLCAIVVLLFTLARLEQGAGVALVAATIAGVGVGVLLFPPPKMRGNWITRFLGSIADAWEELRRHPRLMQQLLLLILIFLTVCTCMVYVAAQGVGLSISFAGAATLTASGVIVGTVRLTPGNIGIQETVYGFLASLALLSPAQSVMISLLIRAMEIVRSVIFAPFAWKKLSS